jgi:hypothetical protein
MSSATATASVLSSGFAAAPKADRAQGVALPGHLDELLGHGAAALGALYRAARVPAIADLSGDLRGRMLALVDLPGPLTRLGRALASTSWFPWRGKSFHQDAEGSGGVNRVGTDRLRLFRFSTSVGPSRAGAFDAVQLDYDRPQNPVFIRAIKDEIRELSPGLYLGQAWLAAGQRAPRLVLYFGLERR